MPKVLRIIRSLCLNIGIVVIHISIKQTNILPLTYLHMVFIMVVWSIFYQASPRILWFALVPTLILELFSATPFGITSCALMITFALMVWLLSRVFPNRSILIVGLAGLVGMILYRFIFFILMELVARNTGFELSGSLILEWLFESSITAVGLTIVYGTTTRFIKSLKPQYIRQAVINR
jgi:hypothetical protein